MCQMKSPPAPFILCSRVNARGVCIIQSAPNMIICRLTHVLCHSSRNNHYYALICTIPLFYILAPTCFGSSLPSSGSLLDPSELLEMQIEWMVYYLMCGYVACVPDGTTTVWHTGHVTTHYMICHPFDLYFR
jgi:hypothetical protein